VNGDWHEVQARDLAGALAELGYVGAVIATAVNGEFVPQDRRAGLSLKGGERIEVLAPMQGG